MQLKVLASGSKGNAYILENGTEALILEAGVPFKSVLQAIEFKQDKIVGCLVSHEHKDHVKYIDEYVKRGIDAHLVGERNGEYLLGGFQVSCFEVVHDVECYGMHIWHKDMGILVFATDTRYIKYRFNNINHWLIECNYSKGILDERVANGFNPSLADRIVKDHMSLETCKDFFKANNLNKTRNIVLLHLSDGNSNAKQFADEIHALTHKTVYVADKGQIIDLNINPF